MLAKGVETNTSPPVEPYNEFSLMTPEATSILIHRLNDKLVELENQLTLDAGKAVDQFEEHRVALRQALHSLPSRFEDLKQELADESHNVKQKLDDLEIQLALARMETEDAYREQRRGLMTALSALEGTIQKMESAKDDVGLVHYKNFAGQVRDFEDKLGALHVHFALEKAHPGEELAQLKEALRQKVTEIGGRLKPVGEMAVRDLAVIGKNIREGSGVLWECFKEFLTYIETEAERHERGEMDKKVID